MYNYIYIYIIIINLSSIHINNIRCKYDLLVELSTLSTGVINKLSTSYQQA